MLATVGFGDIAAVTQTAKILVTIQMLADLVLFGLVAEVLFDAAQRRRGSPSHRCDVAALASGPTTPGRG